MKAKEIADMTVATIESGKYDFIRLNFPGPDMVGHTGGGVWPAYQPSFSE